MTVEANDAERVRQASWVSQQQMTLQADTCMAEISFS